jgi:hypothetical protein
MKPLNQRTGAVADADDGNLDHGYARSWMGAR